MDFFQRRNGILHGDNVDLSAVAAAVGTPCYVYSAATIERHVGVLRDALGTLPHLICYAVKANGNLALLQLMHELGIGFDAVSVGELARVWRAGGDLRNTIVSGVGKRDDEIRAALRARCRYICIESAGELDTVIEAARQTGFRAPVAVRVNPDVDPKTHPYISTGLRENKFGVPTEEATELYARGNASEHVSMVGLSCHIGSQITALDPFIDAAKLIGELASELRRRGTPLEHIGMGGGLGIPYHSSDTPPSPAAYGAALREILAPLELALVLEPGRLIVGNAGVLLAQIIRLKKHGSRQFAVVDAAMNDLLRPALYQSQHEIVPVVESEGDTQPYEMVGPVCESADSFGTVSLPSLAAGARVAVRSVGAYGFVMASNYNGRPRPAEVLCRGGNWTLVRAREALVDLYRGERMLDGSEAGSEPPPFLEHS